MAKQQLVINRFEGGLHTDADPRDIADNEFSFLEGFSVDSLGILKNIGEAANHGTVNVNPTDPLVFKPGYGIYSFSSDYDDAGVIASSNYLALSHGSYVVVYDDVGDAWNGMSALDNTNGFDLGEADTSAADVEHSFYAPNGDLRVCDGNFENINNTPKILKYVAPKTYGSGNTRNYLTTNSEVTVGGDWVAESSSIEKGLDSNHLKMINVGSKTKGIIEGDATGGDFIASIVGNVVTVTDANLDHGGFIAGDHEMNGLTFCLFHASGGSIYGVVSSYDVDPSELTTSFTCVADADGNGSGSTLQQKIAASAETTAGNWSFQVGQQDAALWNKTLNGATRNRGVISADYGVTLLFDEQAANSGNWMPTSNVRYKFYHTTMFDGNQESSPSLFTMYPTRQSAGVTTHDTVDEIWFRDGSSEIGTDSDHNATTSIGTASSAVAVAFSLVARFRSDNVPSSNAWNTNLFTSNYASGAQNTAAINTAGTYNFLEGNERVTGGRIYWASSEDGFSALYLLMDYDLEKGVRAVGSGSGVSQVGGYAPWKAWEYPTASNPVVTPAFSNNESIWYSPPVLESYQSLNGFPHDSKLDAKWKTSVVANGRTYIGNIKRKEHSTFDAKSFTDATCDYNNDPTITHDSSSAIKVGMGVSGTGIPAGAYVKSINSLTSFELSTSTTGGSVSNGTLTFIGNGWNFTDKEDPTFQDRIVKSPVGKFDTFPDSPGYAIELFGSDDGDEIVKLETYADRLLVFKKYKVQIINIQKGVEILEGEYAYIGLDGGYPYQACKTDIGIAWINSQGVYFYDGQQIKSLTDNKIRNFWVGEDGYPSFWASNANDVPSISYDQKSKKILCVKTITDAGSNAENVLFYSFKNNSWTYGENLLDDNVDKRFANYKGQLIFDNDTRIRVWNDAPAAGTGSGGNILYTKDFDFGAPGVRKKIYKVYITYQSGNATTNVQVKYAADGAATLDKTFSDGTNFASNELAAANGWQVAELRPTTSSEANNKYSFRLALTCDGAVPAAFEINDITIIYRMKSIK